MRVTQARSIQIDQADHLTPAARVATLSSHHSPFELSNSLYTRWAVWFTGVATHGAETEKAGSNGQSKDGSRTRGARPLYTADERQRRDSTKWTLVQGVLAPIQFLVFLVSLGLVLRYLATGEGFLAATCSVVVKTLTLYAIMITGAIWERVVFGQYLFAPSFFWEDVFSILVLALHTAYLAALVCDFADERQQMVLALAAYAAYLINATQFVLKLRAARRQSLDTAVAIPALRGAK